MLIEIPEETIAQFYEEALRMEPKLLVAYLVNKISVLDAQEHIAHLIGLGYTDPSVTWLFCIHYAWLRACAFAFQYFNYTFFVT